MEEILVALRFQVVTSSPGIRSQIIIVSLPVIYPNRADAICGEFVISWPVSGLYEELSSSQSPILRLNSPHPETQCYRGVYSVQPSWRCGSASPNFVTADFRSKRGGRIMRGAMTAAACWRPGLSIEVSYMGKEPANCGELSDNGKRFSMVASAEHNRWLFCLIGREHRGHAR
ncbi:uncharacterized protein BO96DRAFT_436797 [Aspergillus niger CBS 101883]|uniref:uncharacterized protein n=1 Tax=Aspergillus lacticoffeatus (strain CBS 101883) TaxID=1450533 RepID=UPI000D7EB852|nr:uncharacterized protein BO96DRAFT_436797 [Aspergillus niger CBS 101883]PYH53895.1 hypothetical protein BO96DRAFT_436797 [Aspergillus niger CBS 101883]